MSICRPFSRDCIASLLYPNPCWPCQFQCGVQTPSSSEEVPETPYPRPPGRTPKGQLCVSPGKTPHSHGFIDTNAMFQGVPVGRAATPISCPSSPVLTEKGQDLKIRREAASYPFQTSDVGEGAPSTQPAPPTPRVLCRFCSPNSEEGWDFNNVSSQWLSSRMNHFSFKGCGRRFLLFFFLWKVMTVFIASLVTVRAMKPWVGLPPVEPPVPTPRRAPPVPPGGSAPPHPARAGATGTGGGAAGWISRRGEAVEAAPSLLRAARRPSGRGCCPRGSDRRRDRAPRGSGRAPRPLAASGRPGVSVWLWCSPHLDLHAGCLSCRGMISEGRGRRVGARRERCIVVCLAFPRLRPGGASQRPRMVGGTACPHVAGSGPSRCAGRRSDPRSTLLPVASL